MQNFMILWHGLGLTTPHQTHHIKQGVVIIHLHTVMVVCWVFGDIRRGKLAGSGAAWRAPQDWHPADYMRYPLSSLKCEHHTPVPFAIHWKWLDPLNFRKPIQDGFDICPTSNKNSCVVLPPRLLKTC